jgi:signal transduction histidine kinase
VDVVALVTDVVGAFRPQAASKQMIVDLNAPSGPLVLEVDPNAVRQVLLNFLDNAVKYGPRSQRIHVDVRDTAEGLALAVADEGPGIAAADRLRVWKAFWRAAGSPEGGTGLGLAIVRELVTLHGGTVAAESAGPRGARFVAVFAAPRVAPAEVIAAHDRAADQPV